MNLDEIIQGLEAHATELRTTIAELDSKKAELKRVEGAINSLHKQPKPKGRPTKIEDQILLTLQTRPEGTKAADLIRQFGVSRGLVHGVLSRLVSRGQINKSGKGPTNTRFFPLNGHTTDTKKSRAKSNGNGNGHFTLTTAYVIDFLKKSGGEASFKAIAESTGHPEVKSRLYPMALYMEQKHLGKRYDTEEGKGVRLTAAGMKFTTEAEA